MKRLSLVYFPGMRMSLNLKDSQSATSYAPAGFMKPVKLKGRGRPWSRLKGLLSGSWQIKKIL